jgi:hypothetical protein
MTSGFEMTCTEADAVSEFGHSVRRTAPLPRALHLWLAITLDEQAHLSAYFHALALFLRVLGTGTYDWVADDEDADSLAKLVTSAPPARVHALLAAALKRLDAETLLAQVPAWEKIRYRKLPPDWQALLERYAQLPHGLLNVVAECLDELIVRRKLKTIDDAAAVMRIRRSFWDETNSAPPRRGKEKGK